MKRDRGRRIAAAILVCVLASLVACTSRSSEDPPPPPTVGTATAVEPPENRLKSGQAICFPAEVEAGKGRTERIKPGRYEVTKAKPHKRTGDPQVRLRAAGKPKARETPWVGERKLVEKGASVAGPKRSC